MQRIKHSLQVKFIQHFGSLQFLGMLTQQHMSRHNAATLKANCGQLNHCTHNVYLC